MESEIFPSALRAAAGKDHYKSSDPEAHMLKRPAAISTAEFSQTPSPPSSDDLLPKLSIGHRRHLDPRQLDLARSIPSSNPSSSGPGNVPGSYFPSSASSRRNSAARDDSSDHLYMMPVLRDMSPLEDMSSDSEEESDDDIPLASQLSAGSSSSAPAGGSQPSGMPVEGSTGEIFRQSKSLLPLSIRTSNGTADEQ